MPRNSAGTYSIPNTFLPGTTIASSAMNANFVDLATALTNSLTRDVGAVGGSRNRVGNPSGRLTTAAIGSVADGGAAGFSGWYALTQSNAVTTSQLTDVADGTPFGMRVTQANASAQRFGMIFPLSALMSKGLRGSAVVLSALVRMSAATTLRYAVLEWTGTADSPTIDEVNDWTSAVFTAGNFFKSTTTVVDGTGSVLLAANTLTSITPLAVTLGSTLNNLYVFFWTDSTQAQNVTMDIMNVQLETGTTKTPLQFDTPVSELLDRLIGAAANGDILTRQSGAWARKAIGSSAQVFTVSAGLPEWTTPAAVGSIPAPNGRLTFESGVALSTTSQLTISTIRYTPYRGYAYPYFDGVSAWAFSTFSELSLALDSNSGHTGYHQSGKLFDVFLDYNAGTPRIVTGPAWTSDTAQSAAVVLQNGLWVNNASMTVRFGTNSGDTATQAAKTALWVGTIYCSANGQVEFKYGTLAAGGTPANFCLWNVYNRLPVGTQTMDSDTSHTYATATWREYAAGTNFRHAFIRGIDEDAVFSEYTSFCNSGAGSAIASISIGIDGATPAGSKAGNQNNAIATTVSCQYVGLPGKGRRFMSALEYSSSGTAVFYGDAAVDYVQNGLHTLLWL